MRKIHLHSEQFDGWLHATCGAMDVKPPSDYVVGEREFAEVSYKRRCRRCARENWPRGGEPR